MLAEVDELRYRVTRKAELQLYAKYRRFSMMSRKAFVDSLRLSAQGVQAGPGDIVECGVWRGGMSAAIAEYVHSAEHLSILFDSFQGLPDADPGHDGEAIAWQADIGSEGYYDNCSAAMDEARAAMALSGHPYRIEPGWFDDTLPPYTARARPIAVLRLDGDWYASITTCLQTLFPLVIPDGVVIIDDYGQWDGCTHTRSTTSSRMKIEARASRRALADRPTSSSTREAQREARLIEGAKAPQYGGQPCGP